MLLTSLLLVFNLKNKNDTYLHNMIDAVVFFVCLFVCFIFVCLFLLLFCCFFKKGPITNNLNFGDHVHDPTRGLMEMLWGEVIYHAAQQIPAAENKMTVPVSSIFFRIYLNPFRLSVSIFLSELNRAK